MTFRKSFLLSYIFIAILCLIFLLNLIGERGPFSPKGNIWNGERASNYETYFNENVRHHDLSVFIWKKLKFLFFQEGLSGVILGREGWLFTDEEFTFNPEALKENQSYIDNILLRFKKENIKILILPVPSKARIYQKFINQEYPSYLGGAYDDFLSYLDERDASYINLSALFQEKDGLYYKTDTHWTPKATQLVTNEIVEQNFISSTNDNFRLIESDREVFEGDLVKYTDAHQYSKENVTLLKTANNETSNDLFLEKYFPIVLIGTSYSADKKWGLEQHLKASLQKDVLNMSQSGKGPFQAMQEYIEGLDPKSKNPKYIIWEIPERYLGVKRNINE